MILAVDLLQEPQTLQTSWMQWTVSRLMVEMIHQRCFGAAYSRRSPLPLCSATSFASRTLLAKMGTCLPVWKHSQTKNTARWRIFIFVTFSFTQVTIIYSGDLKDSRNDVITSVEDYREVCSLTGGLFIPADKVTFKLLAYFFLPIFIKGGHWWNCWHSVQICGDSKSHLGDPNRSLRTCQRHISCG